MPVDHPVRPPPAQRVGSARPAPNGNVPGLRLVGREGPSPAEKADPADMLMTLGHELRTPLASLHATLEMLDDLSSMSPEDAGLLLRRMQRGLTWMEGLVENLAASGEVDLQSFTLQKRPLPVRDVIEMALGVVQPILDRRQQQVRLSCTSPSPLILGDQRRLGQVLVNLLTNASKYSEWGDVVNIEVVREGDSVEVRVTDHGPGIPAREQRQIFDRFVRGSGAAGQAGGLGLGLHIVRSLVESHGGSVGVRSVVRQGSTFWIRLPALNQVDEAALDHSGSSAYGEEMTA